MPPVEASDLVAYLVLQTSFLTAKQFKAYKGFGIIQPICVWLGKGGPCMEKRRKICSNWKSKLNVNSLMTVSIIIINYFRFVTHSVLMRHH